MNCIREGLIPTKYFVKTTQSLSSASGNKLEINFKLSDVEIIKGNISYKTAFILVKNLKQNVILGTPFINLIQPFNINEKGIETRYLREKIIFKFVTKPQTKFLNELKQNSIIELNCLIKYKEKHLIFLQNDLMIWKIENQLSNNFARKNFQSTKGN